VSIASDVGFGLAAAGAYGTADFVAKTTTDRIGFLPTLLYLEVLGTPLLVALAVVVEFGRPISVGFPLLLLAILSVVLVAGTFNLYRAFELGRLSIVSPLASGYPALIVILSLFVLGERLSPVTAVGVILTIGGMVLITRTPSIESSMSPPKNHRLGLVSAIAAFVAFAIFYFGLKFVVGPIPPITAAAISRGVGAVSVLAYLGILRVFPTPSRSLWTRLLTISVLDSSANVFYNFGILFTRSLAVLGTLSGLFSAVTVAWAIVFLRERLGRTQWIGVVAIFLGVALISLG
jgi:drug/metabolite transporter (DMT)-like permease